MKKGVKILVVALWLFLIVAAGHSIFHFYVFGTGIQGFFENGLSGFSIGGFSVGEEKTGTYSATISISQVAVILEWLALIVMFVLVYAKSKIEFNRETRDLAARRLNLEAHAKTDLDKVYELLKRENRISFSAIKKVFEVDDEIVEGWAEILRSGSLATVDYPRIGGPELVLKLKNEVEKGEKK